MKHFSYIIFCTLFMWSCSDFQKALRSEDIAEKYSVGTALFEAEKWSKANRLFDQIIQDYRGKPQGEKLSYMYAMSYYKTEDYYISSYHFTKFADLYPKSEKVQEASFLAAKGYYFDSPVYSKDQTNTVDALEKLQLFVNAYPESEYLSEANKLIKTLDFKLEKKAYEIAKQYDLIKDYKASVNAFNNFLVDFPGTTLREKALFYRFDAAYNLAINSVETLQEERIIDAIDYFEALKRTFSNSEFLEEASSMKNKLELQLSTFIKKS